MQEPNSQTKVIPNVETYRTTHFQTLSTAPNSSVS